MLSSCLPEEMLRSPSAMETFCASRARRPSSRWGCPPSFSRISYRGVAGLARFVASPDMCVRQVLAAHADERLLLAAYLHQTDSIGHLDGPDSDAWRAELCSLPFALEHELLRHLTPEQRKGTLLVVIADHGQSPELGVPIQVADHPGLRERLLMPTTGCLRAAYLYTIQGMLGEAEDYLRSELGDRFVAVRSADALAAGLWGPGQPVAGVANRVGDLVVMARGNYLLDYRKRERQPLDLHGGPLPWEMLVSLLMSRLD